MRGKDEREGSEGGTVRRSAGARRVHHHPYSAPRAPYLLGWPAPMATLSPLLSSTVFLICSCLFLLASSCFSFSRSFAPW